MFYNSSHMEKPLASPVPLFIVGELAEAPDSWPTLVGRFGFPVSLLPLSIDYPEGFPANDLMVNIGLALKELTAERGGGNFSIINLNTLPEVYRPKRIAMSRIFAPVAIIIGLGILAYMGYLVQQSSSRTETLRSQVTASERPLVQQNQEIANLKNQVSQTQPQISPIDTQIGQVTATAAIFTSTRDSLTAGRSNINSDLDTIVSLLPSNVELLTVNHSGNEIKITGLAPSEDDIFKYTRELRSSGAAPALIISSITREEVQTGEGEEAETTVRYNFELLLK
jgi:Tfp pilus assembly protein PilN